MRTLILHVALAGLGLVSFGCRAPNHPSVDAAWLGSLEHWRAERNEEIGGPEGWITLVTRSWLADGASRVGSDPGSEIVLPKDRSPPLAGTLFRDGGRLRFVAADGVEVTVDGSPKREIDLANDHDGHPTVWALGSLTFRVIRRQDRFALRVKDSAHPARAAFKGLTFYAPNPAWRLRARFVPSSSDKTIPIVNVLNQVNDMPSPGTLKFDVEGRSYGLDVVIDDDHPGLFVLFKDATSGHGSYPPGRFPYTDMPAAGGSVELDFNRAFSPPCAFTSFATCPLAPRQNQLSLKIEAGEGFDGAH
jgi:uncharacterized protein